VFKFGPRFAVRRSAFGVRDSPFWVRGSGFERPMYGRAQRGEPNCEPEPEPSTENAEA
jgi:hypothetical protein